MHDLHAAFGQILVLNSVGASMQLAIYRYAIFVLEPPTRTHRRHAPVIRTSRSPRLRSNRVLPQFPMLSDLTVQAAAQLENSSLRFIEQILQGIATRSF